MNILEKVLRWSDGPQLKIEDERFTIEQIRAYVLSYHHYLLAKSLDDPEAGLATFTRKREKK